MPKQPDGRLTMTDKEQAVVKAIENERKTGQAFLVALYDFTAAEAAFVTSTHSAITETFNAYVQGEGCADPGILRSRALSLRDAAYKALNVAQEAHQKAEATRIAAIGELPWPRVKSGGCWQGGQSSKTEVVDQTK